MKLKGFAIMVFICVSALCFPVLSQAEEDKPNILVIWGDDIGVHNISAYNLGIMGYQTPNIDRIGKEGAIFTDAYAQQSCTAGRASIPYRSSDHWHAGLIARYSGLGTDDRRFA
jgi:hypothetical protein